MAEIKLYCASVDFLSDDGLFLSAYRLVSPQRRAKIDRLCHRKDKHLSLGAELLLMYGLTDIGCPVKDMVFAYGENGKPYLPHSPIHFNLSHSGSYVICALSDKAVGCDIEKIGNGNPALAERFFAKSEWDVLADRSDEEKRSLFYRIWTLKESYMKATGEGFRMAMKQFSALPNRDRYTAIRGENGCTYFAKEFSGVEGYACAVCSPDDCRRADMIFADLTASIKEMTNQFFGPQGAFGV